MTPDPDDLALARHELRTPLAVIKGNAQLAGRAVARADGLADGERERLRRHLDAVVAAADALAERIDGLRVPPSDDG